MLAAHHEGRLRRACTFVSADLLISSYWTLPQTYKSFVDTDPHLVADDACAKPLSELNAPGPHPPLCATAQVNGPGSPPEYCPTEHPFYSAFRCVRSKKSPAVQYLADIFDILLTNVDSTCIVMATAACADVQQLSGVHEGLWVSALCWAGSPPLGMASWSSDQRLKQPSPGEHLAMTLLMGLPGGRCLLAPGRPAHQITNRLYMLHGKRFTHS